MGWSGESRAAPLAFSGWEGDVTRASHNRPTPAAAYRGSAPGRRKKVHWSQQKKTRFLDHLAATCNVTEAAGVISVDLPSLYALRRADPGFLAAWQDALEAGYTMLETKLVGHALAGGGSVITNGATAEIGPIDVTLALQLLGFHKGGVADRPRRGRAPLARARPDETDAAILKKLRAMEKRQVDA